MHWWSLRVPAMNWLASVSVSVQVQRSSLVPSAVAPSGMAPMVGTGPAGFSAQGMRAQI